MKIMLTEPRDTSTLIKRFVVPVVLTCFALPAAFAGCIDNPDTRSAIARISHLTEAPETIQDLARAIQGKSAAQIREIFIHRYGPSRHIGSGLDIEVWDVPEGGLVLHPWVGPTFTPKGRKPIWLLATTNKALPNILGGFEMTALPDTNGIQNWLGNVRLRPDRTYRFKESPAVADGEFTLQPDNFFKLHPSGAFQIEFATGCTGETLLEALPDNTELCRLIFAPKDRGQSATYSVFVTDDRRLAFRSDRTPTFEMDKFWGEFWK